MSKQKQNCTTWPELVVFLNWTRNSMNNLSSYCGLVDPRKNASGKEFSVPLPSQWMKNWSFDDCLKTGTKMKINSEK